MDYTKKTGRAMAEGMDTVRKIEISLTEDEAEAIGTWLRDNRPPYNAEVDFETAFHLVAGDLANQLLSCPDRIELTHSELLHITYATLYSDEYPEELESFITRAIEENGFIEGSYDVLEEELQ